MARKYSTALTPIFDFNLVLKPSRYKAGLKKLQFAWSHPYCNPESQNALQGSNNAWNSAIALANGIPFNWEKVSSLLVSSSDLAWDQFTTNGGVIVYATGRPVRIDEKVTFDLPEHSWIPLSVSPNIATHEVVACYSDPNQNGTEYFYTIDFHLNKSDSTVSWIASGSIPFGASVYFTYELDLPYKVEKHITKELHALTDYSWEETTIGDDPNVVFQMDSVTDSGNNPYTLDVDYNVESGDPNHYKVRRCAPTVISNEYHKLTGVIWTPLNYPGNTTLDEVWSGSGKTGTQYIQYVDDDTDSDFEYDSENIQLRRKFGGKTIHNEKIAMSLFSWTYFSIHSSYYPTDVIISCYEFSDGTGIEYFPNIDYGFNLPNSMVYRIPSGSIIEGQEVYFTYKYCRIKTGGSIYCYYSNTTRIKNKDKVWFNYSYYIKSIGQFHDFTNRFNYTEGSTLPRTLISSKLSDGTINWTSNFGVPSVFVMFNLGKSNAIISSGGLKAINKNTGEIAWEFNYTSDPKYLPWYPNAVGQFHFMLPRIWLTWGDPVNGSNTLHMHNTVGAVAIHNKNMFFSTLPDENVEGVPFQYFSPRAMEVLKVSEETGEILARYNTCRTLLVYQPQVSVNNKPLSPYDAENMTYSNHYPYLIEQDHYYSAYLEDPCCSDNLVVFIAFGCMDWVDKRVNDSFGLYAFNQSDVRPAWMCELETHIFYYKYDEHGFLYLDMVPGEPYYIMSLGNASMGRSGSRITFLKNKFIILYKRKKFLYGYSLSYATHDGTFIVAVSSSGSEVWRISLPNYGVYSDPLASDLFSEITGAGDYISFYQKWYGTDLKWHLKLYILNVDTGESVYSLDEIFTIYDNINAPMWIATATTRRLLTKFGGFS